MNISKKEETNKWGTHKVDKQTTSSTSQKVRESINEESPMWDEQKNMYKYHGDKEGDKGKHDKAVSSHNESREEEVQDDTNAEYIDHQDINETNDDDFAQPQAMSEGLSSIYPGRPSTKEDREALAKERQAKMNSPTTKPSQPSTESDPRGEATNVKDDSLQGKLGIARGEVPSGHRDPNYSPARQNYWGDETIGDEPYGDHDADDREIRRKQDEGERPLETDSDYDAEFDMEGYDDIPTKRTNRKREEEEERRLHPYKRKYVYKRAKRIIAQDETVEQNRTKHHKE